MKMNFVLLFFFLFSDMLYAENWLFDFSEVKPSLTLNVRDKTQFILPSEKTVRKRLSKGSEDSTIEPLYFYPEKSLKKLKEISKNWNDSSYHKIYYILKKNIDKTFKNSKIFKIRITQDLLRYVKISKIINLFEAKHHNLSIHTRDLKDDTDSLESLISQVRPFLTKRKVKRLHQKILNGKDLDVESLLLPSFPKKVIKRFIPYRGPNCFHAALAFQNRVFSQSIYYNVHQEKSYHRSMINNDELHRAINSDMYEVDTRISRLKYGDLLVFYEVPDSLSKPPHYRWIKHAAVFLFNDYTFSKGSKSANTPYTIKKLHEEWTRWNEILDNQWIKVFRKPLKYGRYKPKRDLLNWLY